jgi:hypothetical protein
MRSEITLMLSTLAVAFVSGCCVTFSDQTPHTEYHVGDVITSSGTDLAVEKFQYAGGAWTSSGSAMVDTSNYSHGSGKDLNARNVNVRFRFNYPLDGITLKFGELGGNNNIEVNSDFKNVQDLISLNGTTVGNVQVTVNATQQGNNWYGEMTLDGTINDFLIGGQELWLDNICPKK